MRGIIFAATLLLMACGNNSEKQIKRQAGVPDIKAYFTEEIKRMNQTQPGLVKNIAVGDEVNTISADTLDWNKELMAFLALNAALPNDHQAFFAVVDSNQTLKMERFIAKDTAVEIQEITKTLKGGKLEMLEIKTKKRSVWVDRDQVLAYLPGKGYNILIQENYLWASPQKTEIFATIKRQELTK